MKTILLASAVLCVLLGAAALSVASAADLVAAPETYCVQFETNVNVSSAHATNVPILINVTRALAPLGADHLYALVSSGFYDQAAFFRVVPAFVVQFGIAAIPALNAKWAAPIKDDPVLGSNTRGTLSYATAGPNTRTTQLFINYADNHFLDSQGFAPFGVVVQGMAAAEGVNNPTPGNSNGVDQTQYTQKGNAWLLQHYPHISLITKGTILRSGCPIQ